jgi:hypothetical protein
MFGFLLSFGFTFFAALFIHRSFFLLPFSCFLAVWQRPAHSLPISGVRKQMFFVG